MKYANSGLRDCEGETGPLVKISDHYFEARVDERAVGGRANKRLLQILAEHFKIPKSRISIVRGAKSRNKIVQIIFERTAD